MPKNYVTYDMRSYFSRQPGALHSCHDCGQAIFISNLEPSMAVVEDLVGAGIPCHEFSVLYRCKACHWWAIRESWGDREIGYDGPDNLVVGNKNNASDSSQTPNQDVLPWSRALQDKLLYKDLLPLPPTLGRLFKDRQERT